MSPRRLGLRACAKVNWTFEVIARRPDGYHEIRSVLQTVALWDDLTLSTAVPGVFSMTAPVEWQIETGADNMAERALRSRAPDTPVAVHLEKRIPPAAGLGGGSSDAAAVIRGLAELRVGGRETEASASAAAGLGSDVPFFLRGGTQLIGGRGEVVEPLPDVQPTWLVLVTPRLAAGRKTARLFSLLAAEDFNAGERSAAVAALIRARVPLASALLYNAFDRAAGEAFPTLARIRALVTECCGMALLCGAGPSLFTPMDSEAEAREAALKLQRAGLPAQAVATVTAAESTALVDLDM